MMTVKQETARMLTGYLEERIPAVELEAWIVSILDDSSFSEEERDSLSLLRLLLLEAGENLRSEVEAVEQAWDLLMGADTSGTSATEQDVTVWEREARGVIAGAAN
jgi:hypothetical protein